MAGIVMAYIVMACLVMAYDPSEGLVRQHRHAGSSSEVVAFNDAYTNCI